VVPIYQTFWIVVSIIGAGIFFGDFDSLEKKDCIAFSGGVVLTLVGVFVLTACAQRGGEGPGDELLGGEPLLAGTKTEHSLATPTSIERHLGRPVSVDRGGGEGDAAVLEPVAYSGVETAYQALRAANQSESAV